MPAKPSEIHFALLMAGFEPGRPGRWSFEDDAFTFEPPPFNQVLQAGIFDLSILALFNLLFFTGAFVAFLRYDVR